MREMIWYLSFSDSLHLALYSLAPSMLLPMAGSVLCYGWYSIVYMVPHPLYPFICESTLTHNILKAYSEIRTLITICGIRPISYLYSFHRRGNHRMHFLHRVLAPSISGLNSSNVYVMLISFLKVLWWHWTLWTVWAHCIHITKFAFCHWKLFALILIFIFHLIVLLQRTYFTKLRMTMERSSHHIILQFTINK